MDGEVWVGQVVAGRYRVTRKIGAGGMGAVYAAVQEPLGRDVALKVLKPSFARDEVAVARFKREAAIVAALHHPNVVTLHDFGETDDGMLYIVMELLPGATLSSLLRQQGPVPWPRTVPLVVDVVRALAAAHARGVIHRDLKLDNLMLVPTEGDRDLVKVLDFGVAKSVAEQAPGETLTATDSSPGTPGYMSPELARGITTDPRSDFYALGVVWFELLTGRRPWSAKHPLDVFLHQMTQPVPKVRAQIMDVPEAVEALIERMLDKDPEERPADAAELLRALAALGAGEAAPAAPSAASKPVPKPVPGEPSSGAVFLPTLVGAPPPITAEDASEDTVTSTAPATVPTASLDVPVTDPVPARVVRPRRPPRAAALAVLVVAVVLVAVAVGAGRRGQVAAPGARVDADVHAPAFRVAVVPLANGDAPPDSEAPARTGPRDPAHAPRPAEAAAGSPGNAAPGGGGASSTSSATSSMTSRSSAPSSSTASSSTASSATMRAAVGDAGGRAAAANPPAVGPSADELRARLAAVARHLRERMLLPDDVPGYRERSAAVAEALGAGRVDDAAAKLATLERALEDTRLDDAFIDRKIARIEAAFPQAGLADAALEKQVRDLRTEVHERFGARDLPGANLALNRLWLLSLKARMRAE